VKIGSLHAIGAVLDVNHAVPAAAAIAARFESDARRAIEAAHRTLAATAKMWSTRTEVSSSGPSADTLATSAGNSGGQWRKGCPATPSQPSPASSERAAARYSAEPLSSPGPWKLVSDQVQAAAATATRASVARNQAAARFTSGTIP
jgi:hypothetical protein